MILFHLWYTPDGFQRLYMQLNSALMVKELPMTVFVLLSHKLHKTTVRGASPSVSSPQISLLQLVKTKAVFTMYLPADDRAPCPSVARVTHQTSSSACASSSCRLDGLSFICKWCLGWPLYIVLLCRHVQEPFFLFRVFQWTSLYFNENAYVMPSKQLLPAEWELITFWQWLMHLSFQSPGYCLATYYGAAAELRLSACGLAELLSVPVPGCFHRLIKFQQCNFEAL